jgi:hypothetical protein
VFPKLLQSKWWWWWGWSCRKWSSAAAWILDQKR